MLNAEWVLQLHYTPGRLNAFVLFSPISRTFRRLRQLFKKVSNHDKEIIEVYT